MADLKKKKFLDFAIFHPQNGQKPRFGGLAAGGQKGVCPHCPRQNFLVSNAKYPKEQHIQNLGGFFPTIFRKAIFPVFLFLHMCLPPSSGYICCSEKQVLEKCDRSQPKLSFDTPKTDIR